MSILWPRVMWRADSLEKTLILGKIEGGRRGDDRGWDCWMESPTWWTWVWVGSRTWQWTGKPGVLQSMGSKGVWHDWATELNWCVYIQPLANTSALCFYKLNIFLYSACKWHYTIFVCLCLAYFIEYNAIKFHSCSCKRKFFFWIIFHYICLCVSLYVCNIFIIC